MSGAGEDGAVDPAAFPRRYGEWAVVAGASAGIGAAFAGELARRGMHLALIARRGEVLEQVADGIRAEHGVEVLCLARDLADPGTVGAVAATLAEKEVGVLVYNAACVPLGPVLDADPAELDQAVAVNVRAPLAFVHALAPSMCWRGRGGVVLMSSLAGLVGAPGIATYSATKAFNILLAEGLWEELRERGVDVTVCCSGAVPTPGYARFSGRQVPGMLAPDEVARRTLDGLGRGPRFVPGRINRLVARFMGCWLPRRVAIKAMARSTRRLM